MQPTELISLMDMGGPSFAMGDHADHIHVGWRPLLGSNAKLGRAGAPHPVRQPVGPLRRPDRGHPQPGRAHQAFEVLDQGQAQALLGQAALRATPTRASSPGHGVLRGSSSGSASSTSRSRSGRLTAGISSVAPAARTWRWSYSPRCTPSARLARGRRPSRLPPGAVQARAGPDHARDGDRSGAVRRRGEPRAMAGALPRPGRAGRRRGRGRAGPREPGDRRLPRRPPPTRTPTTCRATRRCACGSATEAARSSWTAPGTTAS